MNSTGTRTLRKKLDRLRTDLAELAFSLEEKGRLDAADVAIVVSARVGELCGDLDGAKTDAGGRALFPQPDDQQRADTRAKRER